MFKVLFSKKWIALSLIVLILNPVFKSLSDWQYRRLASRQEFNAQIINAQKLPSSEFTSITKNGKIQSPTDLWRTVTATGSFIVEEQYLLRKRSLESEAGLWVVTPFKTFDGQVITVVRGWTAAGASATQNPELSSLTTQQVTLTGRLREISPKNVVEPTDLPSGQRMGINPKYGEAYLELVSSNPELDNPEIVNLPMPTLTDGPHHSYALQWLLFMVMLDGGYLILLRNDLIERRKLTVV
ncbi:MAG: hypothetical protein RLZZ571_304 [Actinomycetota bacterium]|jgi:cytochrome oxidase assembly protein ShyY1